MIALENMRARFNSAFDMGPAGFSEGMVCVVPESSRGAAPAGGRRGMRVFLAGATGAIGASWCRCCSRRPRGDRHDALARAGQRLRAAGAEAAVADALDAERRERAVRDAAAAGGHPPADRDPPAPRPAQDRARLRAQRPPAHRGHANLVAAARAAGAARIVAQSIAFAYAPGAPGTVHDEDDPLMRSIAPAQFKRSAEAIAELERTVLGAGGLVLRYGYFYGPGSAISANGSVVAGRRAGGGCRSSAAGGARGRSSTSRTPRPRPLAALDARRARRLQHRRRRAGARAPSGSRRSPQALGAKPPRSVPRWLARPLAGEYGVMAMTRAQGASNARAKRELGFSHATRAGARGSARRSAERVAAATSARPAPRPRRAARAEDPLRADLLVCDAEQPEAVDRHRDRSCPAITTAVSPLAPSVRTAIERDAHVDGAEQAADERPPGRAGRRPRFPCLPAG